MAHSKTIRGLSKHNVSRLAWREVKATEDVHHRLGEVRRAIDTPVGAFIEIDLGFGLLQGPSILTTLQNLDEINRENDEKRSPRRFRPSRRRQRVTGKRARRAIHAITRSRRSS